MALPQTYSNKLSMLCQSLTAFRTRGRKQRGLAGFITLPTIAEYPATYIQLGVIRHPRTPNKWVQPGTPAAPDEQNLRRTSSRKIIVSQYESNSKLSEYSLLVKIAPLLNT